MSATTRTQQPPLRVRLFFGLQKQPDLSSISDEALVAMRDAQNRKVSSPVMRLFTGFPDRKSTIEWRRLRLSDRELAVRVYRPAPGRGADATLPLIVHVHGGGFSGTAVQCDWINSHVAARLPAVVISVEHRLVSPGVPFSDAVDDGSDALHHVVQNAEEWGIDPQRVAVVGESAGAMIVALAAIRAKRTGLRLRAQVLINPCTDLTAAAFDHPSMTEHANTPTLDRQRLELLRRLAVPEGKDARAVSPLHAGDLSGLAPALLVVPTLDPLADHAHAYAARLRDAGTATRLSEYPRAGHAFISMPSLDPAARPARREVFGFLRDHLGADRSPA